MKKPASGARADRRVEPAGEQPDEVRVEQVPQARREIAVEETEGDLLRLLVVGPRVGAVDHVERVIPPEQREQHLHGQRHDQEPEEPWLGLTTRLANERGETREEDGRDHEDRGPHVPGGPIHREEQDDHGHADEGDRHRSIPCQCAPATLYAKKPLTVEGVAMPSASEEEQSAGVGEATAVVRKRQSSISPVRAFGPRKIFTGLNRAKITR